MSGSDQSKGQRGRFVAVPNDLAKEDAQLIKANNFQVLCSVLFLSDNLKKLRKSICKIVFLPSFVRPVYLGSNKLRGEDCESISITISNFIPSSFKLKIKTRKKLRHELFIQYFHKKL